MADEQQLAVLGQGSIAWNAWRKENPNAQVDLTEADLARTNLTKARLSGADLSGANLTRARLSGADLSGANLFGARLSGANLSKANLPGARLSEADLSGANLAEARLQGADLSGALFVTELLSGRRITAANLSGANLTRANFARADLSGAALTGANLTEAILLAANLGRADVSGARLQGAYLSRADLAEANLRGANLRGAKLTGANLVETDLTGANLTACYVYGISAWNLKLEGTKQKNLVITPDDEPEITVDNLEVAQFIYLLLKNEKIRHVIDTITSKVVLILGRFTDERKAVLDAIREELRQRDYTPVLFDFAKPASKDLTGTIQTLANMARFIIADLTDPSSVPHELAVVVPNTPVPVQPVVLEGRRQYAMFADLKRRYSWVLEPYNYASPERLIADLSARVIVPAEIKALELRRVSASTT
jgi:uncharacterized protein YjbI with pentapeptide repeats